MKQGAAYFGGREMRQPDSLSLDGRHFQLFLSIFDKGSLPEGARAIGLDPVDANDVLSDLKNALNDDLFVRVSGGLTPTEYANTIVGRIREYVATLEGLSAQGVYLPSEEQGRITIATNVTEMLDEVIKIRDAIVSVAPYSRLRFLELGARDQIEPLLESGDADMVITVRSPRYASSLNGVPFIKDKHVVFYDPAVRPPVRTIEDYVEADHATLDFGGGGKSTIDEALEAESLRRSVTLSAPDAYALGALIKGTPLIATMQARLGRSVFSHLESCEPPLYLPPQRFDIVWHRRADNSPRTAWLRDLIISACEVTV